jgi:hypothetical protein
MPEESLKRSALRHMSRRWSSLRVGAASAVPTARPIAAGQVVGSESAIRILNGPGSGPQERAVRPNHTWNRPPRAATFDAPDFGVARTSVWRGTSAWLRASAVAQDVGVAAGFGGRAGRRRGAGLWRGAGLPRCARRWHCAAPTSPPKLPRPGFTTQRAIASRPTAADPTNRYTAARPSTPAHHRSHGANRQSLSGHVSHSASSTPRRSPPASRAPAPISMPFVRLRPWLSPCPGCRAHAKSTGPRIRAGQAGDRSHRQLWRAGRGWSDRERRVQDLSKPGTLSQPRCSADQLAPGASRPAGGDGLGPNRSTSATVKSSRCGIVSAEIIVARLARVRSPIAPPRPSRRSGY